jgi:hypothetical protein
MGGFGCRPGQKGGALTAARDLGLRRALVCWKRKVLLAEPPPCKRAGPGHA